MISSRLAMASVWVLLLPGAAAASPRWPAAFHVFDAGSGPRSVAAGDLDGDGRTDLAVANWDDDTITILIGDGSGQFVPGKLLATGTNPQSIRMADLNSDANQDLVVANLGQQEPLSYNAASVLLGNGDGTFRPRIDIQTGYASYPAGVAIGELNADGALDLAVANANGSVTVALGNGDGTFRPLRNITLGARHECRAVVIGHFDADRIPDLAVACPVSGEVIVLGGHGDGSFQSRTYLSVPWHPYALAVGDVDHDGRDDLAVVHSGSGHLTLLRRDSTGFLPAVHFATTNGPNDVAIGDVSGDGNVDLVVANGSNTVSVWLGHGGGAFGPRTDRVAGGQCSGVTITAIDAGDTADLAVANYGSNAVSVLLGNGDGSFGNDVELPTPSPPSGVAPADLNGDGHLDLVVASREATELSVHWGEGAGRFAAPVSLGSGVRAPSDVRAQDLNSDGIADLTVLETGAVSVWLGRTSGGLDARVAYSLAFTPNELGFGDVNGDGKVDLVVGTGYGSPCFLLGRGDGSFEPPRWITADFPTAFSVSDFDRDGFADLALGTMSYYYTFVDIWLGNGDGTFRDRGSVGWGATSMITGDLDADGIPDLVLDGSVHRGVGDGTFVSTGAALRATGKGIIGDLDDDRYPDLVITNPLAIGVTVALGRGDGTLGPPFSLGTGLNPNALAMADLNGDRRTDLVVANRGSSTLSLLFGVSDAATPVTVVDFAAEVQSEQVLLRWRVSDPSAIHGVDVERSEHADGPFTRLTSVPLAPRSDMRFEDVPAPNEWWYRLVVTAREGDAVVVGPIPVQLQAPHPAHLALRQPFETAHGAIRISYAVPQRSFVDVAIHDVRGRRLWSAQTVRDPGWHDVEWDRHDIAGARLSRGVYFVTLRAGVARAARKLVLARP